ncbi:hypothetical protein DMA11_19765 [Marinilabiliaceae bacterium JC017]|nr:hypothetical protein DMA11_19765 [Marinilabiliaceae bacterium JC017]
MSNQATHFRRYIISLLAGVLILSGCHNSSFGWKLVHQEYRKQTIDSLISPSAELENIITPYRIQVDEKMNQVIGTAGETLSSYMPESPLTNFVADLMLQEAADFSTRTDTLPLPNFALINHKGLRSPIPKGEIKVHHIFSLMPFENELVILQMKGDKVKELFDFIAGGNGEGLGGASFGIKNKKAVNSKINGRSINNNATYYLVTSDYLANGGDHFNMLTKATARHNTGLKVRKVIIDHIKAQTSKNIMITATTDQRIYHAN